MEITTVTHFRIEIRDRFRLDDLTDAEAIEIAKKHLPDSHHWDFYCVERINYDHVVVVFEY